MAVRTGAGTGVIVSLVVFIIAAVTLLVLAVAFYAGRTDALEQQAVAESELRRFIQPHERNQDVFMAYIGEAERRGHSVALHMHQRMENTMRYVDGNPGSSLEALQSRLTRFGVEPSGVVATAMQRMHNDLQQRGDEVANLTAQRERLQGDLDGLRQERDTLRTRHRDELADVHNQIAGYRQAADDYRQELEAAKRTMNEAVDRLHDQYENRIDELVRENDEFSRQIVGLETRVDDLQQRLSADRLRAQDPSTLVDGRIIDVSTADGTVFIDRGRNHRIVLGMTFEVYDDAAAIRVDPRTGEMPRGKASIQVTRVGEDTSSAKIIRSVPGRSVIRDNVIANAVYDPNYRFKFLVHGRFDVDGDGRATQTEAEYIRNMIRDWGGEVVEGEQIPGDLDFLVLGVPPEPVMRPRDDATVHELDAWTRQRNEYDLYYRLFEDATRAQIPVLNHNRFFVLTGHVHR